MTNLNTTHLGLTVRLTTNFEDTLSRVTAALKVEGFGVLTEIDVKDTLKKKLDVDFRPYKILGACNPPLAYRALSVAPEVAIVDPLAMLGFVSQPDLEAVAQEARARLERVASALQKSV